MKEGPPKNKGAELLPRELVQSCPWESARLGILKDPQYTGVSCRKALAYNMKLEAIGRELRDLSTRRLAFLALLVQDRSVGSSVFINDGDHQGNELGPEIQILNRWTLFLPRNILLLTLLAKMRKMLHLRFLFPVLGKSPAENTFQDCYSWQLLLLFLLLPHLWTSQKNISKRISALALCVCSETSFLEAEFSS